jgi:hypothetical protein
MVLMEGARIVVLRVSRAGGLRDRGWVGCGALLLVLVVAAGCAGHAGVQDSTPHSSPTSGALTGFGTRHVTLSCSDAIAARPADVSGLTDVVFAGLSQTQAVPRAEDVGLRLPPGLHWYFRKAPIVMKANAIDATIAVSGPGQALAWVPSGVWDNGVDLGPWGSSSVTLQSCPDMNALFLGGILAADPTTCMVYHVQSGRDEQTFRQQLNGSSCPTT